jgi:hypothetical protein
MGAAEIRENFKILIYIVIIFYFDIILILARYLHDYSRKRLAPVGEAVHQCRYKTESGEVT